MHFHPQDTLEKDIQRREIDNFSLWFTHFLDFERKGGADQEYKVSLPKQDPPVLSAAAEELLQALQARQRARLSALQQSCPFKLIRGSVDWRMVLGLGGAHVLETSMTLHHVYGLPYIPGSAVKGVLRHYFLSEVLAPEAETEALDALDAVLTQIDRQALEECAHMDDATALKTLRDRCQIKTPRGRTVYPQADSIRKAMEGWGTLQLGQQIFGSQGQRGEILFLDAFPDDRVVFQKDLMNPHYPEYYKEKSLTPPNDCQNPIPIPFLTIQEASFSFALAANALPDGPGHAVSPESLVDTSSQWLQGALEDNGIGAKSAVGYGYFDKLSDCTAEFLQELEGEQQAAEEAREEARLATLSPLERLCAELERQPDDTRGMEIYQQLGSFEGDEQQQLARAIKAYWQAAGKWSGKVSKKQKLKVQELRKLLGE